MAKSPCLDLSQHFFNIGFFGFSSISPKYFLWGSELNVTSTGESGVTLENAKTIFIVEDDKSTRVMLCKVLERHGYKAVPAENGEVAINRLLDVRPDLVILDFMMPLKDGMVVLGEIRRNFSKFDLPVLFLTGKGAIKLIRQAVVGGANDFVLKPIQAPALIERTELQLLELPDAELRSLLQSTGPADPTSLPPEMAELLDKKGIMVYSNEIANHKVSVLLKAGSSPTNIAIGDREMLEQDVIVLGKVGCAFKFFWPPRETREKDQAYFHGLMNSLEATIEDK